MMKDADFKKMTCGGCGIVFFVPKDFYDDKAESGKSWHCPNGHSRMFAKTNSERVEEKYKETLRAKEAEAEAWRKKYECCNEKLSKRGRPKKKTTTKQP